MKTEIKVFPSGDSAITVVLGKIISEEVNNRVRALQKAIEVSSINGLIELTPSYSALMITYNPVLIDHHTLVLKVQELYFSIENNVPSVSNIIEIPTLYGGTHGPDLETVAKLNHLTIEDVIQIHASKVYRIYMLGFTPGFPYLGGMDARIATPRLTEPRIKIPAGSVGIAGEQTGIYPLESPGGWQIIGQTPQSLFNPNGNNPILLKAGDSVKFVPINEEAFEQIQKTEKDLTHSDDSKQPRVSLDDVHEKSFQVLKPGLLTLVQDLGRFGFQQYGVPVSGVMDHFAATVANLLVSNTRNSALLELTIIGPELRFNHDQTIAITGADMSPHINQQPVKMWETLAVKSGDLLSFGHVRSGARAYLAIHGGIEVPTIMQSKSTYLKAHLGGFHGRGLLQGDSVKGSPSFGRIRIKKLEDALIPSYKSAIKIRVILGPQIEAFTAHGIETFLSNVYHMTSDCDRMGYRLEGTIIEHKENADIISDGIAFGAIQVPGNGQPIIMMADRQTTGGYPKIATVISADLPKLAQAKAGDALSFISVEVAEAQKIVNIYDNFFKTLENC